VSVELDEGDLEEELRGVTEGLGIQWERYEGVHEKLLNF
jgi:hypothetical protein